MTDTLVTEAASSPESPAPVDAAAPPTLLDGETATAESTAPGGEGQTEDKSATDKPPEDKPSDAAKGAPESYEDFTLPEGVSIDPEVDANLKGLAKDLNLSQEQAQKVADLGATMAQKWAADLQAQITTASEEWAATVKADKDIGGDKLPENLGVAKAALDKFGTPELRELLQTSRLGNHPEVVRLLVKVGRAISDDASVVTGAPPTGEGGRSLADRLYAPSNTK